MSSLGEDKDPIGHYIEASAQTIRMTGMRLMSILPRTSLRTYRLSP
jgi:hypothetical protein